MTTRIDLEGKLNWDSRLHCIVLVLNETSMRVPRILNKGGCMRPPHHLLAAWKMFGYQKFEVICRRKYKTIEVIEVIEAAETKHAEADLRHNAKFFTRLMQDSKGKLVGSLFP